MGKRLIRWTPVLLRRLAADRLLLVLLVAFPLLWLANPEGPSAG